MATNGPSQPKSSSGSGKPPTENNVNASDFGEGGKTAAPQEVIDAPTTVVKKVDSDEQLPDLANVKHGSSPRPVSDGTVVMPGEAAKAVAAAANRNAVPPQKAQPAEVKPAAQPVTVPAEHAVPRRVDDRGPIHTPVVLKRIDPWSTLKVSLALSLALFIVWMVAVAILYLLLDGMGVWDRLSGALSDVNIGDSAQALEVSQIFTYAGVIGLINLVMFTVILTLGSFIYNAASSMFGGIRVTLADRDWKPRRS